MSFHHDAVRDDFVKFLNDAHMEKVQNRAPRMAWREGTELHLVNLSSLLVVEPEEIIGGWRQGVENAKAGQSGVGAETCGFRIVANLFDNLHIHSLKSDGLGIKWTETITVIPTDRKTRFAKLGMTPP